MHKLKRFILKYCFTIIAPIFILKQLIIAEIKRYNMGKNGMPVFCFRELSELYIDKALNNMIIIGAGSSLNDLSKSDSQSLMKHLTFGIGRVMELDFHLDIVYVEFSHGRLDWMDEFIKRVNDKVYKHENTLFMVEINYWNMDLHQLFFDSIDVRLRKNIRFINHIKSISDKRILDYIFKRAFILKYIFKRNILWHCRTSSFYGVNLALALGIKDIHLMGLDGWTGYVSLQEKLDLNADKKNLRNELHTTYDPEFGEPTILDAILESSKYLEYSVQSKKMIFSNYFKVIPISKKQN